MTDNADRIGVVLMAPGGHPTAAAETEDMAARYDAIGGTSAVARFTEDQRDGLQAALDEIEPDRFHVALGLQHAEPRIDAVSTELAAAGFAKIVGLALTPQQSPHSLDQLLELTHRGIAAAGTDTPMVDVGSWATESAFVDFVAADLSERLTTMRADVEGSVHVVFTAHSLPQRIIDAGDQRPDELRSTAEAVAGKLGLNEDDWSIAWQSAGRTPEPWIGPDILEVLEELGSRTNESKESSGANEWSGVDGVIVSAVGFVADHLEVLFDIDIEASQLAEQVGLAFDRTACVNDEPSVMAALARRVADLA